MQTTHYTVPFATKSLDEQGMFTGYAAVFHQVDRQQDAIAPGAFAGTLEQLRDAGRQVRLLWQHDMAEPIGVIEELREDARGLFIRGRLLMEVARAREAHALLKAGALQGLSIGYRAKDAHFDPATGVRTLKRVELFEVSLVTFPANPSAQVTGVKQAAGQGGDAAPSAPEDPAPRTAMEGYARIALSDALDTAAGVLRG